MAGLTQLFANNAQSQLAGDITAADTTCNLDSGGGALFPNPGANEFFKMTFVDAATGLINEIVTVTGISGDTITSMTRGQEGTAARAWSAGDIAAAFVTANTMDRLAQPGDLQAQAQNYGVDTGSANALAIALSFVPANLTAIKGTDVRVTKGGSDNTGAVTLAVNGLAATPVVDLQGNALTAGALPGGSTFTVIYDGTHFVLQSSVGGGGPVNVRTKLTSNEDFYVATTGSDSNDGLSPGTPWLTMQHAMNVIQDSYDLAGFTATVHCADGSYAAGANMTGSPPPGAGNRASIIFVGSSSCIVDSGASNAFSALQGGSFEVQGMKVQSSGGDLFTASAFGQIQINGVVFGSAGAGAHISVFNNGLIVLNNDYSIVGGADYHMHVQRNGTVAFAQGASITITLTGTPAFAQDFAAVEVCGVVECPSAKVTFSGGATGSRYSAIANGVIDTDAGGASFFPGSIAGSTATGGQYV